MIGRLFDWWHDVRTPAAFGPLHRFPHLLAAAADIADERRAELIALDNISDQLGAVVALLEDMRNAVTYLIPTGSEPAE